MKKGFTLAEVLITLGIIGVVAAMTLPSLVGKYQKRQTVEQLKKTLSTLEQAFKLSEAQNGFSNDWVDTSAEVSAEAMTQYFDTYWRPYLKIMKTCQTPEDCGYNQKQFYNLKNVNSGAVIVNEVTRTAVVLNDGMFLQFVPMNWDSEDNPYMSKTQQIRVDLNGPKPPNRYCRDVFNFVVDLDRHFVKPLGYEKTEEELEQNVQRKGDFCMLKIVQDGWEIKDDYPWK